MQPPPDGSRVGSNTGGMGREKGQSTQMGWEDTLIFDETRFTSNCSGVSMTLPLLLSAESRVLEALFRLKLHLKATYILTDERCSQYSPDDKSNLDKAVRASSSTYAALSEGTKEWTADLMRVVLGDAREQHTKASTVTTLATAARTIVGDFNRLFLMVESDTSIDYGGSVEGKKRKRGGKAVAKAGDRSRDMGGACGEISDAVVKEVTNTSMAGSSKPKRKQTAVRSKSLKTKKSSFSRVAMTSDDENDDGGEDGSEEYLP